MLFDRCALILSCCLLATAPVTHTTVQSVRSSATGTLRVRARDVTGHTLQAKGTLTGPTPSAGSRTVETAADGSLTIPISPSADIPSFWPTQVSRPRRSSSGSPPPRPSLETSSFPSRVPQPPSPSSHRTPSAILMFLWKTFLSPSRPLPRKRLKMPTRSISPTC